MNYKDLRLRICQQRKSLSQSKLTANSICVFKQLLNLPEFQMAQSIGAYMAINGEIETQEIINYCWQKQKKVYLPKLLPDVQMHYCQYKSEDKLIKNCYHILEPEHSFAINSTKLDLVLVPLVAFDNEGHRIGMGAGYYDRHFQYLQHDATLKPLLVGICHSFQKVDAIESAPWDVTMHAIITESDIKKTVKNW